jgi:hypothetical protein
MKFPGVVLVAEKVGIKPPAFCAVAGVVVEAFGVNPPNFGAGAGVLLAAADGVENDGLNTPVFWAVAGVVVLPDEADDLNPAKVEVDEFVCEAADSLGLSSAAANSREVLLEFSGNFG